MARRAGYGFVIAHQCTGEPVMLDPGVAYGDGYVYCRECGWRRDIEAGVKSGTHCGKPVEVVDFLSRSLT